jgi:putative ABC transport system ATP-binding protein
MTILQAIDLTKNYKNGGVITNVIKGINLDIQEGEFAAITGASGSGKSTLLYLLSGQEKPTSGKVLLNGEDISLFSESKMAALRRRQLSFVYQYYNLIPNLSVYDNIVLPVRMDRRLTAADKGYLEEIVAVAGIKNLLKKRPDQLSGGEQQRAALLRAVFIRPKIIFADEPTGNLDSKSGAAVMQLIKEINERYKTTVVMVTHSEAQAAYANRRIYMNDGKIQ